MEKRLDPKDGVRARQIGSAIDIRIGRHISVQAYASVTPAGIISAGVAVAAMTLAAGYLAGSLMRKNRR